MDNCYKVYVHLFPNGKKYVGITCQDVRRRWRKGKSYSSNIIMSRAIEKYGWENIEHVVLIDELTIEEAEKIERELIKRWQLQDVHFGYNIAAGGIHPRHSDATRKKIGETSKGRKHSEEFKKWISEKNSGSNNYMYGKHHADETKQKISRSKKGGPGPNKGKYGASHPSAKSIKALDPSTGEVKQTFGSIVEASAELNILKSCLQGALHGKQKTAGGYKWVYAELD